MPSKQRFSTVSISKAVIPLAANSSLNRTQPNVLKASEADCGAHSPRPLRARSRRCSCLVLRPKTDVRSGCGLRLIQASMSSDDVEPGEAGTRVTFEKALAGTEA